MRFLAVVLLLSACDFQPGPKREKPAAAPHAAPHAAPKAAEPTGSAGPAAKPPAVRPRPAPVDTTAECGKVAVHVANVIVESITDPTKKKTFESERPKLVRTLSMDCTTQAWSDEKKKCFLDAKTEPETEACAKKYPPPTK